ncbi:hypothetical protein BDB01DRAFT_904973 [Pilobolus umbonatus]|nr:hypothetical protein BDB01DRAFT_904973 [Pilobolus umbonatus]
MRIPTEESLTATVSDIITTTVFLKSDTDQLMDENDSIVNAQNEDAHYSSHYMPTVLVFATIGVLSLIACICYLTYKLNRLCKSDHSSTESLEKSITLAENGKGRKLPLVNGILSRLLPWLYPRTIIVESHYEPRQSEPIRYEKSGLGLKAGSNQKKISESYGTQPSSQATSWLIKLLPGLFCATSGKYPEKRVKLVPSSSQLALENLEAPVSTTFVPIGRSVTLVPRSEIWRDPVKRRGVDEIALWEERMQAKTLSKTDSELSQVKPTVWKFPSNNPYPDSPESFNQRKENLPRETNTSRNARSKSEISPTFKRMFPNTLASMSYPSGMYTENDAHFKEMNDMSIQSDVDFVRQELQKSRINNSSSQWLPSY